MCGEARVMADPLQCIQDRFVCILPAASVLPAGVDVIAVRVDDVFIARADEGRRRLVAVLARPVCFLPSCEQHELRDLQSEVLAEPRCPSGFALRHRPRAIKVEA